MVESKAEDEADETELSYYVPMNTEETAWQRAVRPQIPLRNNAGQEVTEEVWKAEQSEFDTDFWNKEMAQTSEANKSEVLGWFVSKFGAFLSNEMMRNIIGQTKSGFDLREVMDNKKILLVNLSTKKPE